MGPCRPCTGPMELELAISGLSRLRLLTNRKRQLDPFQCVHGHILVPGSDDKHDTSPPHPTPPHRDPARGRCCCSCFCICIIIIVVFLCGKAQLNEGMRALGMELRPTHRDLSYLRCFRWLAHPTLWKAKKNAAPLHCSLES